MARKSTRPSASESADAKPRKAPVAGVAKSAASAGKASAPATKVSAPAGKAAAPDPAKAKNPEAPVRAAVAGGAGPVNGAARGEVTRPAGARAPMPRSTTEARAELLARGGDNQRGGAMLRSDPLADAQAARRVVEFAASHAQELSRRGLNGHHGEAALALAKEIEDHLQALPATATAVRARSVEVAELIGDAAALVQPVREAILRVTRGEHGRRAAHAFGIGEVYSARQPQHVLRALRAITSAAAEFPAIAFDAGLLGDDLRAMKETADEIDALGGARNGLDEAVALHESHGALRAYFDLVSAKGALAFAGDPDERLRLYGMIPRSDERRHQRRAVDQAPAA